VLQNEGAGLVDAIESHLKETTIKQLKALYGSNWEYEIGTIKRECQIRADQENEQNYREGLGGKKVHWTEKFTISDYKNIITKKWTAVPKGENHDESFIPFEQMFSINIDGGDTRSDRTKWLSYLNSYRKKIAHRGTIGVGLSLDEVEFLKMVTKKLNIQAD
ncbi:MAG TPA: hypothetical protein VD947_00235, partial [Patescibacteria group bacterium]|nr:hypothetical protein [Patescibacteria group bacterium]